jgi:O-antigen/teichoic acid export membrane protein
LKEAPAGNEIGSIARGAGIVFFGTAAGLIFRYGFHVLAARGLGPGLFGTFFLGLSIYQILEMLAQFGLPSGVVRYVAIFYGQGDIPRIKGTIRSALRIVWMTSVLLAAAVFLLAQPLAGGVFQNPAAAVVLIALAALLPFSSTTAVFVHAAQGFHRMRDRVIVTEILEPAGRVFLVVLLLLFGLRLEGVLAAYALPVILGSFIAWRLIRKRFSPLSDRSILPVMETTRLLSFSWPLLFLQFIGVLLLWTDTLMLGIFRTAAEVGVYGAVQRTTVLGTIVLSAFNTVFAPLISRLHDQARLAELRSLFQTIAKWVFTFSLPLYVGLFLLRKPILGLFGPEFVAGAPALAVLAAGYLVHSGTGSTGVLISMSGKPAINLMNMSVFFVLNIVLNLILIPKYGLLGAAAATGATLAAGNIVSVVITRVMFKVYPFRADFLKPVGSGLLSAGLFWLVRDVLFPRHPAGIVAGGLLFFLSYFILLIVMGLSAEDKDALDQLRRRIFRNDPATVK